MSHGAGRRGRVTGLRSPHPLGELLPGLYESDDFAQRFTAALDEVLAPGFCALDCLESYVDPDLTPPDFLRWLASCLGLDPDGSLPTDRLRAVVRHAAGTLRGQGTAKGIAAAVAAVTGLRVWVSDSGGTTSSRSATAEPPASSPPLVEVTVDARGSGVDRARVERVIAAVKPAHVPHALVVLGERAAAAGGAA
ncbi:MAG TPA: phage tail protein [Actinomycetota bacterium]|nr:phage tail protein [Actinomycetota bacterium]